MAWLVLFIAGLFEVAWAVGLKLSQGFSKPILSALTVVAMILSFYLLARALRHLPLGTAYAVWTGLGAIGTAVIGILFFDESREPLRLLSMGLIVAGVLGLRFFSTT